MGGVSIDEESERYAESSSERGGSDPESRWGESLGEGRSLVKDSGVRGIWSHDGEVARGSLKIIN